MRIRYGKREVVIWGGKNTFRHRGMKGSGILVPGKEQGFIYSAPLHPDAIRYYLLTNPFK